MKWATALVLILMLTCCALLLWSSNDFDQNVMHFPLDQDIAAGTQYLARPLAMTFAHADHAKQQCATCHHNYLDDTGQGLCIDCHQADQRIAFKMRDQFHELCMGCHTEKRSDGESSGPLRNCGDCHTVDQQP